MGGTGLLSGTLLPWFSGGTGPPLAKLLSNRGRRAAGHSLLLSQEASPTPKDRANTPRKTLEGQGNADESEKKWIQVTHQPDSHPQEGSPATNVGHRLGLQAGKDFCSINRGWAVHSMPASSASKTSPSPRNGHKGHSWPHLSLVTQVSKGFSRAAAEVLIPHGPAWQRKWEGSPRRGAGVWLTWPCPGVWLRGLVQAHP